MVMVRYCKKIQCLGHARTYSYLVRKHTWFLKTSQKTHLVPDLKTYVPVLVQGSLGFAEGSLSREHVRNFCEVFTPDRIWRQHWIAHISQALPPLFFIHYSVSCNLKHDNVIVRVSVSGLWSPAEGRRRHMFWSWDIIVGYFVISSWEFLQ